MGNVGPESTTSGFDGNKSQSISRFDVQLPMSIATPPQRTPEPIEELSPVLSPVTDVQEPLVETTPVEETPVDDTEFGQLKTDINDSFAEIASLILDLQKRFELWEERLEIYNRRSSHKI